jgi:hypothetical protein
MTDIRSLRLSLENKLNERHAVIEANINLHREVNRVRDELNAINRVMQHAMPVMALDDCADHIVKEILKHGRKASRLAAQQCHENGDYIIGIDVPSLHIRHRILRKDVDRSYGESAYEPGHIRRIAVNTGDAE